MTSYCKTEAFIFKKEDRFETDRIFSVFSRDFGRIEIFGKAIRKITSKLRGGVEIFSFSEIEFVEGKNKKILTDALYIRKFKNIQKTPEKLEIAYRISDILDSFIKGQEKDEKIWDLIKDVFNRLDELEPSAKECYLVYCYFIWNFIVALGYTPELFFCAVCRTKLSPYNLYFSNREGGLICNKCFNLKKNGLEIKSDIVKILRLILKKDWDTLSKLKAGGEWQKSLKEISANYFSYHLAAESDAKISMENE